MGFSAALKSRVGRRLLARFMLVALLPVILLSGYAYFSLSDLLFSQAQTRIQQTSRSLGLSIVDRLNQQVKAIRYLARIYPESGTDSLGFVQDIRRLSPEESLQFPSYARYELSRGSPVLRFGEGTPPTVTLLLKQSATGHVFLARLNAEHVWQNEMAPENFCVFSLDSKVLYCSDVLKAQASDLLGQVDFGQSQGGFSFTKDDQQFLVGYWRAGLEGVLANPGIIVLVAENRGSALQLLDAFKRLYLALVILALALAAWVAVAQIRRQLRPLNRLTSGAMSLASGQFDERIDIPDKDEFGQLADAFNRMAADLGDRFYVQATTAELDRMVLNASIIDDVIRALLRRLPRVLHASEAAFVHFGAAAPVRLFRGESIIEPTAEWVVHCRQVAENLPSRGWVHVQPDDFRHQACFEPGASLPYRDILMFGVSVKNTCIGLFFFGFDQLPESLDERADTSRGLIDRLAIVAEKLLAEAALRHQAYHDVLTDLPNRSLLEDRAEQALVRSSDQNVVTGLLLADLDKFKDINDSLGHAAGDILLRESAQRLSGHVRPLDTVARLGGDEFVILVPDLPVETAREHLDALARELNRVLAEPVLIQGRSVTTLASIGVVMHPENGQDFSELLMMADVAMYEAKRDLVRRYRWYAPNMNAKINRRFALMQSLRAAIARNELVLHYQPKISLSGGSPGEGKILGAEALVRWQSPDHGLVSPGTFIPLIDEMGLGAELGQWVLSNVCEQMVFWDRQGVPSVPVAINISNLQLQDAGFHVRIQEALSAHGLDPTRLEIEILESAIITQSVIVSDNLDQLRGMGVGVALDDFGTGYSSLSYLTNLNANVLKLDRGFIRDLAANDRQQVIVARIIALAQSLGMTVVAEGVETEAQRTALMGLGCDLYQGYLYSRPLPAEEFAALLRRAMTSGGTTDFPLGESGG